MKYNKVKCSKVSYSYTDKTLLFLFLFCLWKSLSSFFALETPALFQSQVQVGLLLPQTPDPICEQPSKETSFLQPASCVAPAELVLLRRGGGFHVSCPLFPTVHSFKMEIMTASHRSAHLSEQAEGWTSVTHTVLSAWEGKLSTSVSETVAAIASAMLDH